MSGLEITVQGEGEVHVDAAYKVGLEAGATIWLAYSAGFDWNDGEFVGNDSTVELGLDASVVATRRAC